MESNRFWMINLFFGLAMTLLPFFLGEAQACKRPQINPAASESESFDEELTKEDPLAGRISISVSISR